MKDNTHIVFIEMYGEVFSEAMGVDIPFAELMKGHLPKVYQHAYRWKKAHIPFHHAVMIYLACHHIPFLNKFRPKIPRGVLSHEQAVAHLYGLMPKNLITITVEDLR